MEERTKIAIKTAICTLCTAILIITPIQYPVVESRPINIRLLNVICSITIGAILGWSLAVLTDKLKEKRRKKKMSNNTVSDTAGVNEFTEFLTNNGFDYYGYKRGTRDEIFENETFVIRPYSWNDCENEERQNLPNFVYKPENIQIRWYKYPARDFNCSPQISLEHFREILAKCEKSLSK